MQVTDCELKLIPLFRMWVCMRVCLSVCVNMYACMRVCVHVCVHAWVCMRVCGPGQIMEVPQQKQVHQQHSFCKSKTKALFFLNYVFIEF